MDGEKPSICHPNGLKLKIYFCRYEPTMMQVSLRQPRFAFKFKSEDVMSVSS